MVPFIIAAEIGFWVLIAAGLGARYGLRMRRTGLVLLAATPVVDLALLTVVAIDLRGGATAESSHALAAIYLGVSVAFGHRMVRWADVRVAHRFAGGPPPPTKAAHGVAHARRLRRDWLRHALAWGVGVALLLAATWVGGGPGPRTESLLGTAGVWTIVLLVDGCFSLPYSLRPRPARTR